MTHDDRPLHGDGGRPLRVLLRRPLLVGLAALSAVALTTVGLTVLVVTLLGARVDRANLVLNHLQDGHISMLNQETALRGFLITREQRFLQPYQKGAADLEQINTELTAWTGDDTDLAARLAVLRTAESDWIQQWVQPTLMVQPAVGDVAALEELLRADKALFDRYRAVQNEVRAVVEERRAGAIAQQQAVLASGALLSIVVAVVTAIAVRRANRRLASQILPPTQAVRDTLAAMASGDVERRAPGSGPTELRDIADDVNALGDALRERNALVVAREEELVAARDQAEQAGQAKTAFLATMSHEIRTPLNAVLGLTDILLTTELSAEQRNHLETISGSGDSLLTLINDILDFSKIEAGELDLEAAPFDLHGLVYDVAQLLAPQAAGKGIDLLVDVSPDCPWQVVGDGSRLRQVLLNLVGNAVKFTSTGQVVIGVAGRVARGRLRCRLSVSDTGIGIPADQRHRLFRSFSQVDTSTTRSYGGTGLGLAISQRIVRAMGGDITVGSELGVGSTFTVAVELVVAGSASERRAPRSLAGQRLLVVDDNATNLRILEHQLTRAGAECLLADGGAAALARLTEDGGRFDACLLDLHMPEMDGDELADRIRRHPAGADVPLVLLSSAVRLSADGGPFSARLHKPVRPERLLETLQSVLPSASTSQGRRRTDVRPVEPAASRRLRILVAEDHEVNAHLIGLYLRQLGHDFDHVENGRLAVAAVESGRYDVVLMDAQMPVLGGVDATAAIRSGRGPQPRIIAVTASVLASDRSAFLTAGADDFLTKPVRMATLDEALRRWGGAGEEAPEFDGGVPPVAAGESSAEASMLDPETVEELRDLGEQAFAHLYEQYLDSLVSTVEALLVAAGSAAWSEDDEASVPRLAHRLKGSSAAMGASRIADLCQALQHGAEIPDVDRVLGDLEQESRRVRDAVATLLDARR